jgi:hypothetical protein
MTAPELAIIANASKRAAQFTLQQHNRRVDVLKANPDLQSLVPFFSAEPMASTPTSSPTMRYNPTTGKLEAVR